MSPYAKIKPGCHHIVGDGNQTKKEGGKTVPSGKPGRLAEAGEVIEVTDQELISFPDKLEEVSASAAKAAG